MRDEHSTEPATAARRVASGGVDAVVPASAIPNSAAPGNPLPPEARPSKRRTHPDPTRYGDWEKGGRCIDF